MSFPRKVVMAADPPPLYFIHSLLPCYSPCSRKPHSHTDRLWRTLWPQSDIGQTKPMHCILTDSVSTGNGSVETYVKGHVTSVDTVVSSVTVGLGRSKPCSPSSLVSGTLLLQPSSGHYLLGSSKARLLSLT